MADAAAGGGGGGAGAGAGGGGGAGGWSGGGGDDRGECQCLVACGAWSIWQTLATHPFRQSILCVKVSGAASSSFFCFA